MTPDCDRIEVNMENSCENSTDDRATSGGLVDEQRPTRTGPLDAMKNTFMELCDSLDSVSVSSCPLQRGESQNGIA